MARVFDLSKREFPAFELVLDDTKYEIRFTLPVVSACQQAIGLSLVTAEDWWSLPLEHVSTVLVTAIQQSQPEPPCDQLKEIFASLPIETLAQLRYELVKTNFPVIIAKYEEAVAKKVVAAGETLPNA